MSYLERRPDVLSWSAAERKRLLEHIAVLPDPRRVSESLREESLMALINALSDRHGGYRLAPSERGGRAWRQLVAAGIVESSFGGIGNFGMLVRTEAFAMRRRGELG